MTGAPAASVLVVALEPRAGSTAARRIRSLVNAVGALLGDDATIRDTDLVVRRIHTGEEALRTAVDSSTRDFVLAEAKADLERLGEAEFLREWNAR